MQTKILLVNPACLDERISDEDARIVPIGLYYIAAQLLDAGFHTELINLADVQKSPEDPFLRAVESVKPDIIGFSVTNPNRWNAIECAETARKISPETTLVFGGPAPTFMPEHLFEACPQLDFIVTGEGEITFLKLANAIEQNTGFDRINGLVFRHEDALVNTGPRPLIENLDDLVPPSRYFTYQHLAMSRGCPGNCTFCGSPQFWGKKKVRHHSPEWFVSEIEALAQKGVSHFYISDDTFTMEKSLVLEVCKQLKQLRMKISWNAISRVDFIDADILSAMRQAGCIQISFGVESGSESIRRTLGKPIDHEKIIQAFSLTRAYGILPRAYFIYGSPGETRQTIQESIDLMQEIQPLGAVFYMLVVFPGTYLYRSACRKQGFSDSIWHKRIEDLPWFEVDAELDFSDVKGYGDCLRKAFYENLPRFVQSLNLSDKKKLYPYHADFLSRLAMTFSHGEYAADKRVTGQDKIARHLYEKALSYAPDSRAYLGLAMLLQKHRQFEKAASLLGSALESWPDHQELNVCMGVCLMNTDRFQQALEHFEKFSSAPGMEYYIDICQKKLQDRKK